MACASTAPKVIDGSVLEGGGQILRIASALSCLTNQPITVQNIRAGRSNPGLRPQHMTGLQLLRDLSSGDLRGDSVGSTEITLTPSEIKGGKYVADTKTAGSIVLLLQASMPCMMFAAGAVNINLTGGTNATMAPQIDYTTLVFQPTVAKFGVYFDCDVIRRGYYPKGGGEIEVRTNPVDSLQAVNIMDVGRLTKIEGRAFVAGVLPVKIAHSMAKTAREILESRYRSIPVNIISIQEDSAVGNGSGIIVVAETSTGCKLAGSALGKRGILAEQVGKEAAEMLSKNLDQGGCVDEYLQDQLILFMALAQGKSRILTGPVTLHTLTAIHITGKLTQAKFKVTNTAADGSATTNIIECEGIGLQR